jgi:hypothetical protein
VKVLLRRDLEVVACEELHRILGVFEEDATAALVCQTQGVRPKVGGDGGGPAMFGVHDHGSCSILEVADFPFSDAVLEMGVDAAEREGLTLLSTVRPEDVVGKAAVVTVVLVNGDVVPTSEQLEGVFGGKCLDSTGGFLHV